MSDWCNILDRNKYYVHAEKVKNIEDVDDDFASYEDLGQEFPTTTPTFDCIKTFHNRNWGDYKFDYELIRTQLDWWISQIPKGKRSVKITDNELLEALTLVKSEHYNSVSDFYKGKLVKISQGRIAVYDRVEKAKNPNITYADLKAYISSVEFYLNSKGIIVSIDIMYSNRHNVGAFVKQAVG